MGVGGLGLIGAIDYKEATSDKWQVQVQHVQVQVPQATSHKKPEPLCAVVAVLASGVLLRVLGVLVLMPISTTIAYRAPSPSRSSRLAVLAVPATHTTYHHHCATDHRGLWVVVCSAFGLIMMLIGQWPLALVHLLAIGSCSCSRAWVHLLGALASWLVLWAILSHRSFRLPLPQAPPGRPHSQLQLQLQRDPAAACRLLPPPPGFSRSSRCSRHL
jgi:hypothetical protein